jgi:hypothetical protein
MKIRFEVFKRDGFQSISLRKFLKLLPLHEIEEAMLIATSKVPDHAKAIKYFCGICWSKIRGNRDEIQKPKAGFL